MTTSQQNAYKVIVLEKQKKETSIEKTKLYLSTPGPYIKQPTARQEEASKSIYQSTKISESKFGNMKIDHLS